MIQKMLYLNHTFHGNDMDLYILYIRMLKDKSSGS